MFVGRRQFSETSKERPGQPEDNKRTPSESQDSSNGSGARGPCLIPNDQSSVSCPIIYAGEGSGGRELQRKSSVRKRMLSKVKSGLSVRSKSNINMRSDPCAKNADLETSQEQEQTGRSTSQSSADTSADKLEKILRLTYLNPIAESLPSIAQEPTASCSFIDESFCWVPAGSQRPMPPMLSAHVNLRPYTECIDLATEHVIWAGLEIQARCNTENALMIQQQRKSLNFIIIIDNSYDFAPDDSRCRAFAHIANRNSVSIECLSRACTLAYEITLDLDAPGDKIAVYSTSRFRVYPPPSPRNCVVHPLKAPDLDAIRHGLLVVQRSAQRTSGETPSDCVDVKKTIQEIVTGSLRSAADIDPHCPHHIVVLSPKSREDLQQNDYPATTVYHYISPWNDDLRIDNAGKCTDVLATELHQDTSNLAHMHPWTDLRVMMQLARLYNGLGQLRNVTVQVQPRSGCKIETKYGPVATSSLEAGQTLSMLMQLRVPRATPLDNSWHERKARYDGLANTIATSDDIIVDLQEFLGDVTTELFAVKVRYQHSLFPANNRISIRETCRVRRSVAASDWSLPIATSMSSITIRDNQVPLQNESHGHEKQTLGIPNGNATENCHSKRRQKSCSMDSVRLSSESPIDPQIGHSPDKARKIWQHMRKESRSGRGQDSSSCESLAMLASDDSELCHIKKTAIKNKRSLGASTLRGFRQDMETSEEG